MRRHGVVLFALGSAAFEMDAKSWSPPRETHLFNEANVGVGFSPRPTEAPRGVFGRMVMPREDFTMGPATCGFEATVSNSFTCVTNGATCTPQNGFVGCCQPNSACSAIKTTCINYSRSSAGACDLPSDYHTLCCATSTIAECFTWVVSTAAKTDSNVQPYTLFACSATGGRGTLLTRDPAWPAPSTSSTPTQSPTSASASATTTAPPPPPPKSGGGGTNVGAIAGGVVGGVVGLALVILVAFYFFRKRPQPPSANPQPDAAVSPTSPASGQGNYQYGPLPPQNYDPNMVYNQQYGGYQQQPPYPGQYPTQGYYGAPPPGSVSPPPASGSPDAFKEGGAEHQVQELQAVNPVGAENNRAELPSS